jgi:DNA polymerase III delta' subunit
MNWNIIGHKQQLAFIENALQRDRLAHGLLFAGPNGVGKFKTAKRLAQVLVCEKSVACDTCSQCMSFLAGSNADYMELAGDGVIKIEQVRDLIYKLSLKPYSAKYKIAVIDSAEDMTDEAANALLKSLEEPKSHTVIILVTANPNRLPKTIVSRTQKINFGAVRFSEFESLLPSNISVEQKEMIASVASGKPGTALSIASNEDLLKQLTEISGYYDRVIKLKLSERLIAAAELADWETPELVQLFNTWLAHMQEQMRKSPDKLILKRIRAVTESYSQFEKNANTKLVLANLMVNI